tara:strand:- start:706 stop:1164 length:459 start_codon:yes stop_codon:yes gene_type:complete
MLKKKLDILILFIITFTPIFLKNWDLDNDYYYRIVMVTGIIPIALTHTTSIGLKFKQKEYSLLWLLLIFANFILYHKICQVWLAMLLSFLIFNSLRILFKRLNRQDPIPIFIAWPGLWTRIYNMTEKRMENNKDLLFTILSMIGGLSLLLLI